MEDGTADKSSTRSVIRNALEVPIIAGLAVLIVVVLRALVVQPFYIPSASMEPQLMVNDKILVSRISYRLHGIHRGDLVVFNAPPSIRTGGGGKGPVNWVLVRLGLKPRNDVLVKRVIGLPGDTIEVRDGHVFVDGRLLLEPYLPVGRVTPAPYSAPVITVPPHQLWVLGDNRQDSEDSHFFGPIAEKSVIGRAVARVWPLDKIAFL